MNYWLVVYNEKSDEFYKDNFASNNNSLTEEEIIEEYVKQNDEYKVIHIGVGDLPPTVYRSLKQLERLN
jgi:hypothetical protein